MQLTLFLANNIECEWCIEISLSWDLYFQEILQFIYVMWFFHFRKKLLLFNVFLFVIFRFVTTGNINKQMKTKLLKNEEDIFFSWMLKHINTSFLFYFSLGHDVWNNVFQVRQTLIPVGHCPMTGAYFQPCLVHHHKSNIINPNLEILFWLVALLQI